MGQTPAEWLENQADRSFARQRAEVDTAKLLATFAAGVAATLVATSLQVGEPSGLDLTGTIFLAAAVLAVVCVIALDRIAEADQGKILELSQINKWTQAQVLRELRKSTVVAAYSNAEVVLSVRRALIVQVILSCVAGTIACVSLLN
jgi:hypothetical protein